MFLGHFCRFRPLITPTLRSTITSLSSQNHNKIASKKVVRKSSQLFENHVKSDEADEFGKLAPEPSILNSEYLSDDDDGYDVLEKMKRRRGIEYYDRKFVELRYKGGHDRAKKMYELWMQMKQEDRFSRPWKNHYSLIITVMAKSGLTDKAFLLFKELVDAKRNPSKSMITSLFNACGQSYDRNEGLSYAHYLRDWIYENGVVLDLVNYNSMIKAFARNGDLKMCFKILEEMASFGHNPDDYTFNMLLQGAISDKQAGFSHAVRILREKLQTLPINEPTLRQFLTCTRKCGVGSLDHLASLIEVGEFEKLKNSLTSETKPICQLMLQVSNFNILTTKKIDNPMELLPLLNISSLNEPHNRLALVGGLNGIFNLIEKYNVKLTPPLFLELLQCLPPQLESEQRLLNYIRKRNFIPEASFFNELIKRRAFRMADESEIKQALNDMKSFQLQPDIITFGVLALSCRKSSKMKQFLKDMHNAGFKVNIPIMNALINNSCHNPYYPHLEYLLRLCASESIQLEPKIIEKILFAIATSEKYLMAIERGEIKKQIRKGLGKEVEDFKIFFENYSKKIHVRKEVHEREQFDFEIKPTRRLGYNKFVEKITNLMNNPSS